MSNNKKSRNEGAENMDNRDQPKGEQYKTTHKGGPSVSNRQTGDHEKDDSSKGAEKNTTKKGSNAV